MFLVCVLAGVADGVSVMIADLPLALLRPTTCIRSTLVHTKALHLLTPRVIYLPHHCMAFIPPPPPPFVALLTICSLVHLLLPPICMLQGALFSFQQAVLGSWHPPLLPCHAQFSNGDSGDGPHVPDGLQL